MADDNEPKTVWARTLAEHFRALSVVEARGLHIGESIWFPYQPEDTERIDEPSANVLKGRVEAVVSEPFLVAVRCPELFRIIGSSDIIGFDETHIRQERLMVHAD